MMLKDKGFKIPENLVVIVLPAIAYLLAFSYQYGYAKYFGIPIEFISVDLKSILLLSIAIPSIYQIFSGLINLIPVFKLIRQSVLGIAILRFCIMLIFSLFFVGEFGWYPVIFASIFSGFFEFVFPLITQRKHKGFKNKLQKQEELELELDKYNHLLQNPVFSRFYVLVSLLVIVLIIVVQLGGYIAMNKKFFLVTGDGLVVLAIYDNYLVSAEFDKESQKITSNRSLINLASQDKSSFTLEKVGPLKFNYPED